MKQNAGIRLGMLVCLSIALLAFRTHATSIEVSGEVSGQWNVDTVKVTSDIFLPGDQTLTIDPGVRVEFMGHFQFTVRGSVIALGLPDEMIEFTRSDTTGFSDTLTDAGTPDTSSLMVPGRDLAGNPRIYNNRLDIGAYEWNPGPGIASNERQGIDVTLFPVPAFENLTIRFTLNNAHKVGFSVYRMSGELVYRHTPVDCSTGTNEICWDLKDHEQNRLSAECYVLQLHGNHLSNGVLFYLTDEK